MGVKPRVSAIVSSYNAESLIHSRITNLLSQRGVSVEVIVVDSGSAENEMGVVRELQREHPNVHYLRTENETLYCALNRGLALATGEYVTNANTDDRYLNDSLAVMVGFLDQNPEFDVVYGDVYQTVKIEEIINFDGIQKLTDWRVIQRKDYSHRELLLGCLCGPQPLWRRRLHQEYGLFDGSYVVAGDYEFWLRIAEHVNFAHLEQPLGLVYKNIHGLEWRNRNLLELENLRIRTKYFQRPSG